MNSKFLNLLKMHLSNFLSQIHRSRLCRRYRRPRLYREPDVELGVREPSRSRTGRGRATPPARPPLPATGSSPPAPSPRRNGARGPTGRK